ncbi:MAG: hypothetical protein K2F85_03545, partial [Helicobacter sp.]|nr:hypothetical protein [Helicobacter sp.]
LAYVIVHSACVNVMPTARTLPLCAVAGTLRLKSNGESKIAIFKARLCCGFAIALRALLLGIVCVFVGDSDIDEQWRIKDNRIHSTADSRLMSSV